MSSSISDRLDHLALDSVPDDTAHDRSYATVGRNGTRWESKFPPEEASASHQMSTPEAFETPPVGPRGRGLGPASEPLVSGSFDETDVYASASEGHLSSLPSAATLPSQPSSSSIGRSHGARTAAETHNETGAEPSAEKTQLAGPSYHQDQAVQAVSTPSVSTDTFDQSGWTPRAADTTTRHFGSVGSDESDYDEEDDYDVEESSQQAGQARLVPLK